jgi:hypothetical protein
MSKDKKEETETEKPIQLKDIHDMMKAMMTKLEKLDLIEIKVHACSRGRFEKNERFY